MIVIGVDVHKHSLMAAAIDELAAPLLNTLALLTRRSSRGRARSTATTEPAAVPTARRTRSGRGGRKARAKPELPLGDATLRTIETLGNEASAEQIREHLGREFGMQVRANHLGMALAAAPTRRSAAGE